MFFVYDADVASVVDKLRAMDGSLLLSDSCIELWFLLHMRDHRKPIDAANVVKTLMASHPNWRVYSKGALTAAQCRILIDRMELACSRGCSLQGNPSSDLHRFIAALQNLKNA